MYKRELDEYEEAMKIYTLNGGPATAGGLASTDVGSSNDVNENGEVGMASAMSSPAQSTEMSMDFPSDPAQNHDSPDVGSIMDDDDMKDVGSTPQSDIYHSSEPMMSNWQPPV